METFVAYKDRPALDKGEFISWRDLESGMLFRPMAGAPNLRRVRGTAEPFRNGGVDAYLIGSENAETGSPTGGIVGCADDTYRRSYLDGRPIYTLV